MQILLTTGLYVFQIGVILIAAVLVTKLIFMAADHMNVGKKRSNKMVCSCVFLLLMAGVIWWMYHPPVSYEPGMRDQIPDENLETLVAAARGLYSSRLPLWPLYIRVVAEDKILVQYFPEGTVYIECGDGLSSGRVF